MILTAVPDSVLRAANSEVRKITSLRVNRVVAGSLAGYAVVAFAVMGLVYKAADTGRNEFMFLAGWSAIVPGLALLAAVVLAAVLGAVASGDEYRLRSLGISALFTPDRNVLFGAKLGVVAAVSFATVLGTELLGGAAFALFGRDRVQLTGDMVAIFGGVALAAVCWSVIGAALGFLLRTPVQAIAVMVGVAIIEPLVWITARAIGFGGFATLLPIAATVGTITNGAYAKGDFIAPTPAAIAVLLIWTAASAGTAWWFFTRRDL
ncbi:ABC transporter permease [Nocardia sp. SYP-A9097]|uniref:ABC transporter permease n=1 Tax=Nocardia sp. SYP-A9097 TaxID=2663237 RepID=UPI00129B8265|nr:ABC transporter permease [Nocardia sp. SYP-A9097]MRH91127.1 ABC transporter permease [Nocardia sp. SYP-A9097]